MNVEVHCLRTVKHGVLRLMNNEMDRLCSLSGFSNKEEGKPLAQQYLEERAVDPLT